MTSALAAASTAARVDAPTAAGANCRTASSRLLASWSSWTSLRVGASGTTTRMRCAALSGNRAGSVALQGHRLARHIERQRAVLGAVEHRDVGRGGAATRARQNAAPGLGFQDPEHRRVQARLGHATRADRREQRRRTVAEVQRDRRR